MADTEVKTPGLVPVDLSEIPEIQREGKASRVVEGFLEANVEAMEVTDAAPSFDVALKRYVKANSAPVRVIKRGKGDETRIFLKYDAEAAGDETPEAEGEDADNA